MKTKQKRGPMPRVEYDGEVYCMTSRKTEIPDLYSMDRMAARLWLLRNTRGRGYGKETPNISFGGAVSVS